MYYGEQIIDEVRERNDIVDVISSYVALKKKGGRYFGLCPFHNEKTGSFSVSPDRQMYYCFGCGAGGNVFGFIMQYENLDFQESVQFLAKRAGITLPEKEATEEEKKARSLREQLLDVNRCAATHFYHALYSKEGEAAHAYFLKRGLSDETIRHFGLGYSSRRPGELYRFLRSRGFSDSLLKESGLVTIEEKGARDKFWNRAMFPIMDANSRVIGFGGRVMGDGEPKYLNSPETKLFDKSRNLYGLNYARTARKDYFLLCEGYMDVISLQQAGFVNAVASLGTALTSQHCALLKRYVKQVVLTYDSDGAGVRAAERAIPLLREAGISSRVLSMTPCKDPDEFIKAYGPEEYQKRIDEARNSFLWQVDQVRKRYRTDDPEQKTLFIREVGGMLSGFEDPIERGNYLQAVAREQMIPEDELKSLVNRLGEALSASPAQRSPEQAAEETRRKRSEKEDASVKSQKLLLTWLSEDRTLMARARRYISPEDFTDPLCREIASKLMPADGGSPAEPASILNDYMDDRETMDRAAAIFNTRLRQDLSESDRAKAASDSIRRILTDRLDREAASTKDLSALQEILKRKAALKTMKIAL